MEILYQGIYTRKIFEVSKIPNVDFCVISGKTYCEKKNTILLKSHTAHFFVIFW